MKRVHKDSHPALRLLLFIAMVVGIPGLLNGQEIPTGYVLPKPTRSPDGRYGVLVPDMDSSPDTGDNILVEWSTGKTICVIEDAHGLSRKSYGDSLPQQAGFWQTIAPPQWSADSSMLLWHVNGKWSPQSIVLLKIKSGVVKWQVDVLKAAQKAILARTRKADPAAYLAVKRNHSGWGSSYPDGFTVDVDTEAQTGGLSLPLVVHASLTSDPKLDEPAIQSELKGVVNKDSTFSVSKFHYGPPD